ncbi:CwfJ C-terminus 1-domain-containing protein-like protein [Cladochytrium replicatum]|nr:CwfJ C-terminus 1-domain-containing protein-like protein [Cladochytrium replicatum]
MGKKDTEGKDRKRKKEKKHKERKRRKRDDSASEDKHADHASLSSGDEWVEKVADRVIPAPLSTTPNQTEHENQPYKSPELPGMDWLLRATEGKSRAEEAGRKKTKRELELEESQRTAAERELNPALSSMARIEDASTSEKPKIVFGDKGSSWRMMKLKRIHEIAEEEGRPVEEVAIERLGSLEAFHEAVEEREFLDAKDGRNRSQRRPGGNSSKFVAPTSDGRSNTRRMSPEISRERRSPPSYGERPEKRYDNSRGEKGRGPDSANDAGPILSVGELNRLKAEALKARLMKRADWSSLENQYEREKERAEKNAIAPISSLPGSSSGPSTQTPDQMRRSEVSQMLFEERFLGQDYDRQLALRIAKDSAFELNTDSMDDKADLFGKLDSSREKKVQGQSMSRMIQAQKALDKCNRCYTEDKRPDLTVISIGTRAYLALPDVVSIVPGHCWIVPMEHCVNTLECSEECWDEIRNFMKCLMLMFGASKQSVIFMEQSMNFRRNRHAYIECIPLPEEKGEEAPAYFRETILASEEEWSQHKKLIDTHKNGFRRSLVKQMPYFHVWFNPNGGLGHVIENEESWPAWFGQEVVGGMLELPTDKWRRPKRVGQRENAPILKDFLSNWTKYDWTAHL